MELQCHMLVICETQAQRDALMPFLIQGERPFRDDLDGPAQELFDLTAHCLIADTINHAGSSSIELFWDVTKDLDGLELTSAALSMAAVRVLTAVVPDEDGSFLWLSEHGENFALERDGDDRDDPLGTGDGSWDAIQEDLEAGTLTRRSMGSPLPRPKKVRAKGAGKAPTKGRNAARGAGTAGDDDAAWLKRRKAMVKANRMFYRWDRSDRDNAAIFEEFMLSGRLPRACKSSPLNYLGFARDFDAAHALRDARDHVPTAYASSAFVILDALLRETQGNFCSEFGMFDGREREIVRALLPARFDVDTWRQQAGVNSQDRGSFAGPLDVHEWMMEGGLAFLTAPMANPHDPVQDIVDYWRQTLPFLDELTLCGHGCLQMATLMRVLYFFREPRGRDGDDTPARRFRDALVAVFDTGTGNAALDRMWADVATPRERCRVLNDSLSLEPRVLLAAEPRPRALREIHGAFQQASLIESAFDPDAVELVTLANVMSAQLAKELGYLSTYQVPDDAARVPIPACRYRIDFGTRLSVGQQPERALSLDLFQLQPAPGRPFDATLPQLLLVWTGERDDGATRDDHAALIERQIMEQLDRDFGLCLARSDTPREPGREKAPFLTRLGVERYWVIPPRRRSDYYIADSGYGQPGKRRWQPWPGKFPAGIDLDAFRAGLR